MLKKAMYVPLKIGRLPAKNKTKMQDFEGKKRNIHIWTFWGFMR